MTNYFRGLLQLLIGVLFLGFGLYGLISGRVLFGSKFHSDWVTFATHPMLYVFSEALFLGTGILCVHVGIRTCKRSPKDDFGE